MKNLINLKDLFIHEILDLHSSEKQIIEALPEIIDNAYSKLLKNALSDHLEATRYHKARLEEIHAKLSENNKGTEPIIESVDFFSRLFGGVTDPKCRGTEGLIKEGKKIMDENMTPEVRDAAIIAATQKIEHYQISGYGTALAYAKQLHLEFAAALLQETLREEYAADDLLTKLAVDQLNIDAEKATDDFPDTSVSAALREGAMDTEGRSLFADYARDVTSIPPGNEEIPEVGTLRTKQ